MKTSNEEKLVEIYEGNLNDATNVQFLLANEGIETFMQNELMGTIAPWQVAAGGAAPVKIMITEKNIEKSIEILKSNQIS